MLSTKNNFKSKLKAIAWAVYLCVTRTGWTFHKKSAGSFDDNERKAAWDDQLQGSLGGRDLASCQQVRSTQEPQLSQGWTQAWLLRHEILHKCLEKAWELFLRSWILERASQKQGFQNFCRTEFKDKALWVNVLDVSSSLYPLKSDFPRIQPFFFRQVALPCA